MDSAESIHCYKEWDVDRGADSDSERAESKDRHELIGISSEKESNRDTSENYCPPQEKDDDYAAISGYDAMRKLFQIETAKLWKIAAPIAISNLCEFGISFMVIIFAGHMGNLELFAASIGLNVINTFSYGFLLGMGSALETLCGQAYGAGQVHLLGIYMQRSFVILFVSCICLSPIYIFATPILKLLGQEDEIAHVVGKFTILLIPGLFSYVVTIPTQKFLQAQSKLKVMMWIGLGALIVNVGLLFLFVYGFDWGLIGTVVAFNVISWGISVCQAFYVMGWFKGKGWNGFSWSAFKDIWTFLRLSLQSAVMLCLELWYSMSLIVLTGHLDNAVIAVDSLSICMNFNEWEMMLFLGIHGATSVRVSNELGVGHPRATKYSVYVTLFQSFLLGIFFMAVVLIARNHFAIIFTTNKTLLEAVSKLAYLLAGTMVLNSVQLVISGVAIGSGWQALAAYINIGSYYIFGIPLGVLLGYKVKLGVMGLWGGMMCGTALQTLLLLLVICRTNWNKEVEQTTERLNKWRGQDPQAENEEDVELMPLNSNL